MNDEDRAVLVSSLQNESWLRLWGAVGAQVMADRFYIDEPFHHIAVDLAAYKCRQLYHTCVILTSTREVWRL